MGLLRQVPNRSRKLAIPITEELEQRLESVRRRCQEQHMELPFQDAFESFLAKLLDDAEAEANRMIEDARSQAMTIASEQEIVRISQQQADQVVVVDGGRVVGAGTHDRLLVECPVYAEFVDSQSIGAGVGGQQ